MVKKKRIMLRTFLWPGWGHLALGKRKKGWFLWWASLIGLLIIAHGITMWLLKQYAPAPEEEVPISENGVISEEMFEQTEETQGEEENLFAQLILPLTITLIGLAILTWAGVYAYRDTKKLLKE